MTLRNLENKKPKTVEELIDRGGDVREDKVENKKEWTNFVIRIRKDLLFRVDKILEERIGMSKTAWILEAIQEKLKKEKGS